MTLQEGLGGGSLETELQPNSDTNFGNLEEAMQEIHNWARAKGFSPGEVSESVALFASEGSEMLEEDRAGHPVNEIYYKCAKKGCGQFWREAPVPGRCPECGEVLKPEGVGMEAADLLIRVLHWFIAKDLDPEVYMEIKMAYNWTRAQRNGGKAY